MSDEFSGVIEDTPPVSEEQVPQAGQPEPQVVDQPKVDDAAANKEEALRVMREQIALREREADFYKQQAQYLQEQQRAPVQQKPEFQPDDILTVAEAEKLVESRLKQIEEKATARTRLEQEARAKAQYPDFADVVEKVGKKVTDRQWALLMASDNPAEEVYQWGKQMLPELARANATQGITTQIQRNLSQAQTLTNVSGQAPAINPAADILNAPRDKFNDYLERFLNS